MKQCEAKHPRGCTDEEYLADELEFLHPAAKSGTGPAQDKQEVSPALYIRQAREELARDAAAHEPEHREKAAAFLHEAMHAQNKIDPRVALCLSGGGIRSATFNLGVLQGLAHQGLLKQFTYLSTVSGGGYIGSWLTAWLHNEAQRQRQSHAKDPQNEALNSVVGQLGGVGRGQAVEPAPIQRLRAYSNYLTPMRGMSGDGLTLIAIFMRNLVLNWLVFIPLMLLLVLAPRIYLSALQTAPPDVWLVDLFAGVALAGIVITIAYMASDLPAPPSIKDAKRPLRKPTWDGFFLLGTVPLVLSAIAISILVVWHNAGPLNGTWIDEFAGFARRQLGDRIWLLTGFVDSVWLQFALGGVVVHLAGGILGAFILRPWRNAVMGRRAAGWRTLLGIVISGCVAGLLLWAALVWLAPVHAGRVAAVGSGAIQAQAQAQAAAKEVVLGRAICPPSLRTAPAATQVGIQDAGKMYEANQQDEEQEEIAKCQIGLQVYATWAVPALLMVFWFGVTAFCGWGRRNNTEDDREWWARAAGGWLGAAAAWLLLTTAVLHLPGWILGIPWLRSVTSPGALGTGAALLGVVISIGGYLSKEGPALRDRAESLASRLGVRVLELASAMFIVTLAVCLCYGVTCVVRLAETMSSVQQPTDAAKLTRQIAEHRAVKRLEKDHLKQRPGTEPPKNWACGAECASIAERAEVRYEQYLGQAGLGKPLIYGAVALLLLGSVVSLRIGTNAFSLHNLYGNRLMRAYLGASRPVRWRMPHWYTGFDPKDNVAMADLPGGANAECSKEEARKKLFPVVNAALNLVTAADNRLEWQDRKAAAFTITPRYTGSQVTGYVPTAAYTQHAIDVGNKVTGMSLGRAMAISGAAAAPNMGYHSSPLVAFVMTFFNVRLGLWLPNTKRDYASVWSRSEPDFGVATLLSDALGRSGDNTPFVSLSDGGHFDNLGLYEMVRRRCHRILVCDASCDPDYTHADLESVLRKIRIDLGITIEFPAGLPGPKDRPGCNGARLAIGVIHYGTADAGAPAGEIYYIKPILLGDEPMDLLRYAGNSRKSDSVFPQQPTSDQFFDEAQFESYRLLGLHTVLKTFTKPGSWPLKAPSAAALAMLHGAPPARQHLAVAPKEKNEAPSLLGKAAEGVRSLSHDAVVLASVATVGVIGVTGAVSLSNPTVTLNPSTVSLQSDTVKLDATAPGTQELVTSMKNLQSAINGTTERLQAPQTNGTGLNHALADLEKQLVVVKEQKLSEQVVAMAAAAQTAASGLRNFQTALKPDTATQLSAAAGSSADAARSASSAAQALNKFATDLPRTTVTVQISVPQMASLTQTLSDIKNDISQMLPRRNIRGSTEVSK